MAEKGEREIDRLVAMALDWGLPGGLGPTECAGQRLGQCGFAANQHETHLLNTPRHPPLSSSTHREQGLEFAYSAIEDPHTTLYADL
eukprot:216152-Pelagomonas_calceolata.AAC.2